MAKIKIATDSTADIPADLQKELNITVLPFTIISGDTEYSEGVDIFPEDFYEILESCDKLPTTSQTAPMQFSDLFNDTWNEGYTDLIHICINSKGSATWQGAIRARDMFFEEHPEAVSSFRIHIIDSKTYSMSYGWAAVLAARMAAEGSSVDEILESIQDWLTHTRPLFVPLNLRFVKKSGRVSAAAAFVGDAMGLKPMITFIDGESKIVSKIRGESRVIKELLETVKRERKPGTPYFIAHGSEQKLFGEFREACLQTFEQPPEFEYPLGCIISINTGPNAFGIVYRT